MVKCHGIRVDGYCCQSTWSKWTEDGYYCTHHINQSETVKKRLLQKKAKKIQLNQQVTQLLTQLANKQKQELQLHTQITQLTQLVNKQKHELGVHTFHTQVTQLVNTQDLLEANILTLGDEIHEFNRYLDTLLD